MYIIFVLNKLAHRGANLYKSLTYTWMWKLGLRPWNSFSWNTSMGILLQCIVLGGKLSRFPTFCIHLQGEEILVFYHWPPFVYPFLCMFIVHVDCWSPVLSLLRYKRTIFHKHFIWVAPLQPLSLSFFLSSMLLFCGIQQSYKQSLNAARGGNEF